MYSKDHPSIAIPNDQHISESEENCVSSLHTKFQNEGLERRSKDDKNRNENLIAAPEKQLVSDLLQFENSEVQFAFENFGSQTLESILSTQPLDGIFPDSNLSSVDLNRETIPQKPTNKRSTNDQRPFSDINSTSTSTLGNFPLSSLQKDSVENENSIQQSEVSYKVTSSSSNPPSTFSQLSFDPELAYIKLLPLINSVEGGEFAFVLLKVLLYCLEQLPLDDLYNLLYNFESPDNLVSNPIDGSKIDKHEPTLKPEAIKFCHFIIETFRLPKNTPFPFQSGMIKNPNLFLVNIHEFLRVFLAIKIILDTVEPIEDSFEPHSSLLRIMIYKVYYILCNTLIQKYPISTHSERIQKKLVLGQSQIGKLTKLAFPNSKTKRIGKRGHSRYHYLSMKWKESIISEGILKMAELEMPELEKHFKVKSDKQEKEQQALQRSSFTKHRKGSKAPSTALEQLYFSLKTPQHTFIDLSSTFLEFNCSPRVWKIIPGMKPEHSDWSKNAIQKSMGVLKSQNIDIDMLAKAVTKGINSTEIDNTFFDSVAHTLRELLVKSAPKQAYLSLYLSVLLVIFPINIASESEIPNAQKLHFRQLLNTFMLRLQSEFIIKSPQVDMELIKFSNILKMMLHLNVILLTRIKTSLAKDVISEVVHDVNQLVDPLQRTPIKYTKIGEIAMTAVFSASKAFGMETSFKELQRDNEDYNSFLMSISEAFIKLATGIVKLVAQIPSSMSADELKLENFDLPVKIFNILSRIFHEDFLLDPSISRLPIPMIRSIMLQMMYEVQMVSFHDFGKRNNALSQETFKLWWLFSIITHEYVSACSEITALSLQLSKLLLDQ